METSVQSVLLSGWDAKKLSRQSSITNLSSRVRISTDKAITFEMKPVNKIKARSIETADEQKPYHFNQLNN